MGTAKWYSAANGHSQGVNCGQQVHCGAVQCDVKHSGAVQCSRVWCGAVHFGAVLDFRANCSYLTHMHRHGQDIQKHRHGQDIQKHRHGRQDIHMHTVDIHIHRHTLSPTRTLSHTRTRTRTPTRWNTHKRTRHMYIHLHHVHIHVHVPIHIQLHKYTILCRRTFRYHFCARHFPRLSACECAGALAMGAGHHPRAVRLGRAGPSHGGVGGLPGAVQDQDTGHTAPAPRGRRGGVSGLGGLRGGTNPALRDAFWACTLFVYVERGWEKRGKGGNVFVCCQFLNRMPEIDSTKHV